MNGWGKSKTSVIKYSVEFNDFAEPSVSVEDSVWKTVFGRQYLEDSIFGRQYLRKTISYTNTVCDKYAGEVYFIGLLKKKHTCIIKSVKHKKSS